MLCASCSVVSFLASAGALPPALLVEKNRGFEVREVAFGLHAIHQNRADHAAPADQTYEYHLSVSLFAKSPDPSWFPAHRAGSSGLGRDETERQLLVIALVIVLPVMAATTASPISRVPTFRVPALQMSGVR